MAITFVAVAGASETIGHAEHTRPSLSPRYTGAACAPTGSFVARRPSECTCRYGFAVNCTKGRGDYERLSAEYSGLPEFKGAGGVNSAG